MENISFQDQIIISYFLHGTAFIFGLNQLKNLRFSFIIVISLWNLMSISIAFSLVDFAEFQLGFFNGELVKELNWFFSIYYFFYFVLFYFKKKPQYLTVPFWSLNRNIANWVCIFLFILQLLFVMPISGLNEFISYTAIGVLVSGFYQKENSLYVNIILIFIISFQLVNGIVSSLIFEVIHFTIFLVVVTFILDGNGFFKTVVSITILFLVGGFAILFSPVKMAYRNLDLSALDNSEKLNVVIDLIESSDEHTADIESENQGVMWRLTYSSSAFSLVMERTPLEVPFWDGESYKGIFYKFIPRILWSGKPQENLGQTFGHRYNLIAVDDYRTSMNTPFLAEGFMNFGYFGVYFIVLLMSVITANLYFDKLLLISNQKNDSNFFLILIKVNIATLTVFLTQWESNFSMFIGKIVILFLTTFFIVRLLNAPRINVFLQ